MATTYHAEIVIFLNESFQRYGHYGKKKSLCTCEILGINMTD